jgi:hypothetical protein
MYFGRSSSFDTGMMIVRKKSNTFDIFQFSFNLPGRQNICVVRAAVSSLAAGAAGIAVVAAAYILRCIL